MSANKRHPYWFIAFVALAATLAGLHPQAFANGTNVVGNSGKTLRDGGAGCTGSGCHSSQTATVVFVSPVSFMLPGQSSAFTVRATDATGTSNLRMGVDVATKKDTAGTNGTLSESASNLLAVSATEVVHCTSAGSGCAATPSLNTTDGNGRASYNVTFTMPGGAVAGEKHNLYATARLGLGVSGGSWNHAGSIQVTAAKAPLFTSAAPPSGTIGVAYSHTFTASGTPAPTFAPISGSFPNGLNLVNGVLSGTPTATGTFNATVRASNGFAPNASQAIAITIAAAPVAPVITSPAPPATGTIGVPYNHAYTATGNPAPAFIVLSGTLPSGLGLVNGVVSGTPSAVGTFNGTVRASNGVAPSSTQAFSITITAASTAPVITSAVPPPTGTVGVAYNHTYTASGNPAPTFAVTAGALPTGVSLVNGVLSGSPNTAGTFNGTVTASNGAIPDATQAFSITVAAAPALLNFQGLWWKPTESGWGINFTHQGNVIFATWFTFGADNQPQWFTSVARNTPADPNIYAGPVSSFTGPPFNTEPFPPNANVRTEVGSAKLTFAADGQSATFEYTVNGISQVKQIIPQELFPGQGLLPTCAFGTALADLPLATNYQSLWWATHGSDTGGDESGWGINFTHHGTVIFATWFTYDVNGKGWWLFSVASQTAPGVFTGTVRTAVGPPFSAEPFDPNAVVRTTVGNTTITFADGNHATFQYTVNGVAQTKNLVRQLFDGATGTVCQ